MAEGRRSSKRMCDPRKLYLRNLRAVGAAAGSGSGKADQEAFDSPGSVQSSYGDSDFGNPDSVLSLCSPPGGSLSVSSTDTNMAITSPLSGLDGDFLDNTLRDIDSGSMMKDIFRSIKPTNKKMKLALVDRVGAVGETRPYQDSGIGSPLDDHTPSSSGTEAGGGCHGLVEGSSERDAGCCENFRLPRSWETHRGNASEEEGGKDGRRLTEMRAFPGEAFLAGIKQEEDLFDLPERSSCGNTAQSDVGARSHSSARSLSSRDGTIVGCRATRKENDDIVAGRPHAPYRLSGGSNRPAVLLQAEIQVSPPQVMWRTAPDKSFFADLPKTFAHIGSLSIDGPPRTPYTKLRCRGEEQGDHINEEDHRRDVLSADARRLPAGPADELGDDRKVPGCARGHRGGIPKVEESQRIIELATTGERCPGRVEALPDVEVTVIDMDVVGVTPTIKRAQDSPALLPLPTASGDGSPGAGRKTYTQLGSRHLKVSRISPPLGPPGVAAAQLHGSLARRKNQPRTGKSDNNSDGSSWTNSDADMTNASSSSGTSSAAHEFSLCTTNRDAWVNHPDSKAHMSWLNHNAETAKRSVGRRPFSVSSSSSASMSENRVKDEKVRSLSLDCGMDKGQGSNRAGSGGGGGGGGIVSGGGDGEDPLTWAPPTQMALVECSSRSDSEVEPTRCQVCGDISAGFHCGAYVCEACKKFFVRCLKQQVGIKFLCPRNQCCDVTKETRTQCQYCRYRKCLGIGMYKPGKNLSTEIGHIPCKVCGAPSSGYHFGAITCEGCKGFFRRTIKERDHGKYRCSKGSDCAITTATRNVCKYCRYQKCLDAGMTPEGSRIGRQPNAIKHATMIELNQIKMDKGLSTDLCTMPPLPQAEVKQELEHDPPGLSPEFNDMMSRDPRQPCQGQTIQDDDDPYQFYTDMQPQGHRRGQGQSKGQQLMKDMEYDGANRLQGEQCLGNSDDNQASSVLYPHQGQGQDTMGDNRISTAFKRKTDQLTPETFNKNHCAQTMGGAYLSQGAPEKEALTFGDEPPSDYRQHHPPFNQANCLTSPSFEASSLFEASSSSAATSVSSAAAAAAASVAAGGCIDTTTTTSVMPQSRPPDLPPLAPLEAPSRQTPDLSHICLPSTISPSQQSYSVEPPPPSLEGSSCTGGGTPAADVGIPSCGVSEEAIPQQDDQKSPPTFDLSTLQADYSLDQVMEMIGKAVVELAPIRHKCTDAKETLLSSMNKQEVWYTMMAQFKHSAMAVLRFAKKLPGFRKLVISEQIMLLQAAMYPVVLTMLAQDYDTESKKENYFNMTDEEKALVMELFPAFLQLLPAMHDLGETVRRHQFDSLELGFLCTLFIYSNSSNKSLQEFVIQALEYYSKQKGGEYNRMGLIMLRLGELERANVVHKKAVFEIMSNSMNNLDVPQLFEETFLNDLT